MSTLRPSHLLHRVADLHGAMITAVTAAGLASPAPFGASTVDPAT